MTTLARRRSSGTRSTRAATGRPSPRPGRRPGGRAVTADKPGRVSEAAHEIRQPRNGHPALDTESAGGNEVASELLEAAGEGGDGGHEPGLERMREAARVAAAQAEETGGFGQLGRPLDRRSPFFIGLTGAAGVVVTIALVELVRDRKSVV